MGSFKIIALKTGTGDLSMANWLNHSTKGVAIKYLKNLAQNTVYRLYNSYSFPNKDFSVIQRDLYNGIDLYSLKLRGVKKIPVSINAIVGENGSGKSTLIELIYWINYNLGCTFGLLEDENSRPYQIDTCIDIELLYTTDDKSHYILQVKGGQIKQQKFELVEGQSSAEPVNAWRPVTRIEDLSDFFYTLVINYSQYALNALEVGEWINPLFHKNDGYQTPIVLNPMRHDGNIDINREKHLLSRRLQAVVLEKLDSEPEKSLRNLANGKIAKTFEVEYNRSYFEKIDDDLVKNATSLNDAILMDGHRKEIVEAIQEVFNLELKTGTDGKGYYSDLVIKYVWNKLKKIVWVYPLYQAFRSEKDRGLKNIKALLEKIKSDNSHITFKLKGAILHIKHYELIYKSVKVGFDYPFQMDIEAYSRAIEKIKSLYENEGIYINTYMMAMPSFFTVDVLPGNAELSVGSLSSGEKQRIYSLSSIVYHLINLNSVEEQKLKDTGSKLVSYRYINLILDEIEMYYHPDWQRTYIFDLLKYLEKISPDGLNQIAGINILFVTHSPFILSDIPNTNILRLQLDGPPKEHPPLLTFAANINDILANDFFLGGSFMGEYARTKINELIDFIKKGKEWKGGDPWQFIEMIDEPIIREDLKELYIEGFGDVTRIDAEIERLQKLKKKKFKEK